MGKEGPGTTQRAEHRISAAPPLPTAMLSISAHEPSVYRPGRGLCGPTTDVLQSRRRRACASRDGTRRDRYCVCFSRKVRSEEARSLYSRLSSDAVRSMGSILSNRGVLPPGAAPQRAVVVGSLDEPPSRTRAANTSPGRVVRAAGLRPRRGMRMGARALGGRGPAPSRTGASERVPDLAPRRPGRGVPTRRLPGAARPPGLHRRREAQQAPGGPLRGAHSA